MQTTEAELPTLVSPIELRDPTVRKRKRRRVERAPSASGSLFEPRTEAVSTEEVPDELESGEVQSAAPIPSAPSEPAQPVRLRDAADWAGTAEDDARMQALVDRWTKRERNDST